MVKVNGRTITDDLIIKVATLKEAQRTVGILELMGYNFCGAKAEKFDCYYIAQSVVFDDGSEPTKKFIRWGRNEVEESGEFNNMMTYEDFILNYGD